MKRLFYIIMLVSGITFGQTFMAIAAKGGTGMSPGNTNADLLVSFVTSKGDAKTVVVEFSTIVNKASAETKTNYTINNDVTVSDARLAWDQKSVILTTSPLSEQSYVLTVQNVQDLAAIPNTIAPTNIVFKHYAFLEDIVAFYNLDTLVIVDNDTLVYDASSNANNGMTKNSPFTTIGLVGNALGFDGVDDYVTFPASESFDISAEAVSISLWTNMDYLPTELGHLYGPLFDSETDQYVLYEDKGNSELRFKVTTSNGAERPGIPEADLVTGEWIHIVGVYDGTNAMIYLNAELKDSHPLTGTVNPGQIATLGKSGSTYFSGSIDQVEVYNRALTENEIFEKYFYFKEAPVAMYPVSVAAHVAQPDFSIYPNPNNGQFTIDLNSFSNQYVRLEIINSLGKIIYKDEFNSKGKKTIQIPSAPAGLYIVRVFTGTEILKQNMIIK